MKKKRVRFKTIISIMLIQAFLLLNVVWAQPQSLALKQADYLSPSLQIGDSVFRQVIGLAIAGEQLNNPAFSLKQLQGLLGILQDPEISLNRKIEVVINLSKQPMQNDDVIKELRKIHFENRNNFFGSLLAICLMRNNPSFWIDGAYTQMDKNKFLQILRDREIAIDDEKIAFAEFLKRIIQRRRDLIKDHSEGWAYPYTCMPFSGIMMEEELKKQGFKTEIIVREYPKESNISGVHSYLIITLGKNETIEEFILDLTLTQFQKITQDTFEETGIAIIPLSDIQKNPEKFFIYTAGRAIRKHFVVNNLTLPPENEHQIMQQVIGKLKFVYSQDPSSAKSKQANLSIVDNQDTVKRSLDFKAPKDTAEYNNFLENVKTGNGNEDSIKLRSLMQNNAAVFNNWFSKDADLEARLEFIAQPEVLKQLDFAEARAKKAVIDVHFVDRYGFQKAEIIESDRKLESDQEDEQATNVYGIDADDYREMAFELFCGIDRAINKHSRLGVALSFFNKEFDIALGVAKSNFGQEGSTIAVTHHDPQDEKQKNMVFSLFKDEREIDYGQIVNLIDKDNALSLLELVLGHELAHLFVKKDLSFILLLNQIQVEQLQALSRKHFGVGLNFIAGGSLAKVFEFIEYAQLDKNLKLMDKFGWQDQYTKEQIETEFISMRSFDAAPEFLAEYLAFYILAPDYLKAKDPVMYQFMETIIDWDALLGTALSVKDTAKKDRAKEAEAFMAFADSVFRDAETLVNEAMTLPSPLADFVFHDIHALVNETMTLQPSSFIEQAI